MSKLQEELQSRLAGHGWTIVRALTTEGVEERHYATAWWLASTQPPAGREVLVQFRVHTVEEDNWYMGWFYRILRFEVTVRYPTAGDSPTFTGLIEQAEGTFRTFFRVLDWFRDPLHFNAYDGLMGGDWLPPEDWDSERWRAGAGLEETWDTTATPNAMLHFVKPTLSARKLRLLTCAICRQMPISRLNDRNRLVVELAEQYAEEMIPKRELKKASKSSTITWLASTEPTEMVEMALLALRREDPVHGDSLAAEAIREVVANPFRTTSFRRAWLRDQGGLIQRLVDAVVEGDEAAMPILADALEDAGCSDPRLLEHCRQAKPHARGCWVMDLLSGKG
jgi:hypothetical protein